MDTVHLHLLLNHVPVLGVVFGVLLYGAARFRRDDAFARFALGFSAALAVVALVVYLTGEPAEEAVENLPGVSDAIIERHEDAALLATIAMGSFGALALGALVRFRRRAIPLWVTASGLIASIGLTAVMGWTANLGGQIRHSEIRSSGVASMDGGSGRRAESKSGEEMER